tara:strand:- start:2119 stop:2238 length:120 start_codon:yes stop_codon:yes gene_type:complete
MILLVMWDKRLRSGFAEGQKWKKNETGFRLGETEVRVLS